LTCALAACYSSPHSRRAGGRTKWDRGTAEQTMDRDDVLLNSSEVAVILDLSPDTVNEFARKSILPGFKKGRQWRFRKRDVASYKRQLRGMTAA
jgi:excisionase family DNA binding protein